MKRVYFIFCLLFTGIAAFAQTNVTLQINHRLGPNAFQSGTQVTNNLGQDFDVDRLQYYISEIRLAHDGSQALTIPDLWILVNANQTVSVPLGNHTIGTLEGISFGIGVDSAHNHLDPSQYAMNHPLAPQSPSMHWGWASGYRFVAMEGNSGTGLAQTYEVHALEDVNYFYANVITAGTSNGQDLLISIDADYVEALRDVDVASGPISHGGTGASVTVLENFREHVFTAGLPTSAASTELAAPSFAAYPNPSSGNVTFLLNAPEIRGMQYAVYDAMGRRVQTVAADPGGNTEVNIPVAGCYSILLEGKGGVLATKRVVITE
jgi:hypothetical protein